MVQYQEGTGANCRLPLNPPFFGEFTKPYTETPGSMGVGFADVADITNVQLRAWQTDLRPQVTHQWNLFVERQITRYHVAERRLRGKRLEPCRGLPRLQPGPARRG